MCVDAYLKNYLLKIIKMYSESKNHVDVWHDGRFLDRWAEKEVLFSRLASQTATMKGYKYPKEAGDYAKVLLNGYFPLYFN